jgi:hypothetical protein
MTIKQKIKHHLVNKKYCRISREAGKDNYVRSSGYIIGYSKDFIIFQESAEFDLLGYLIFPIKSISDIRFNKNDQYYNKIMKWEKKDKLIQDKYSIDLTNWTTIFKSIKSCRLSVIIENEDPEDESFDIGPITKVTKTSVYIHHFNAAGKLNKKPTKISWNLITIIQFADKYSTTFSKYAY